MSKAESLGHVLKVELDRISPPIWRRLEVPAGCTLGDIHGIIQTVMDWDGWHLHIFVINKNEYGATSPEYGMDYEEEEEVLLEQVFKKKGDKGKYHYDFGDGWVHTLTYMGPSKGPVTKPRVIAGRRATPPEDSGGPWRYPYLLDAFSNENHPEHENALKWLGEDFDPEHFDRDTYNARLST